MNKLSFKTLSSLYLQSTSIDQRKQIYKELTLIKNITEEDLLTIINYCSLYNRSYKQIKNSSDNKLYNGDYLNNLKIILDVFIDILQKKDSKQEYISETNNEYDYIDIIIYYLKQSSSSDVLFSRVYEVFDICVWNDLKVFYKVLYIFLTDDKFYKLKEQVTYEMFNFKEILFNYLRYTNSDVESIIKHINSNDYSLDVQMSTNYYKLKELIEIRSICCDKSLTFFADGYKMMDLYRRNILFDYSAICLQYFKVIEIELKEKVVNHCAYDLNKQKLFEGLEYLNLTIYHDDFLSKIELGKIRNLLRKVKSLMYDVRNDVVINYVNDEIEVFYSRLISLFSNVKTLNFYLDIINHKVIELYRNSSVHTGIVSYERAVEAQELTKVFLKNISKLNYGFKVGYNLNLKYETPKYILELIQE